jgi:hypothetical protein
VYRSIYGTPKKAKYKPKIGMMCDQLGSSDKELATSSFMTRIKFEMQRENISLLSIPSRLLPKKTSVANSEP